MTFFLRKGGKVDDDEITRLQDSLSLEFLGISESWGDKFCLGEPYEFYHIFGCHPRFTYWFPYEFFFGTLLGSNQFHGKLVGKYTSPMDPMGNGK